jgi:hypothetical protein
MTSADRLSVPREVESGGGGGSQSPCNPPPGLCVGNFSVRAGDAALDGSGVVGWTSNRLNFSITGQMVSLAGFAGNSQQPLLAGHFPTGVMQLSVTGGNLTVSLTLKSTAGQTVNTSGSGKATQTLSACSSGGKAGLTTKATLQLKHLGKTEISERHDVVCP